MLKNLKVVAIALAIAVVAVTIYKGVPAFLRYIEEKAITEVENRQQKEQMKVERESNEMIVDFNHALTQEVMTTTEYFNAVSNQMDEIIKERQPNAVELPATKIESTLPKLIKPDEKALVPLETKDVGISELTLAWQAFCRLRPMYKDCLEGTHP